MRPDRGRGGSQDQNLSNHLEIWLVLLYQEFTVALIRVTSSSRFFELFSTLFLCFRLFLTCKIDPKIDAKSYPEGAWGDLRGLPEASRRPPGLVFGCNSPWIRIMSDFVNFLGRPGTALGTRGGLKNSLKIDFLLKNGVPNVLFRRFLCTKLGSTLFAWFFVDFSQKIDEKSMKKTMRFFTPSLGLFNMATRTKHCILRYENNFFIFRVFAFFSKKTSKNVFRNRDHVFPSKITQKSSPGTRFGTQNGPELTSGRSKNQKMWQKSRFWTQ